MTHLKNGSMQLSLTCEVYAILHYTSSRESHPSASCEEVFNTAITDRPAVQTNCQKTARAKGDVFSHHLLHLLHVPHKALQRQSLAVHLVQILEVHSATAQTGGSLPYKSADLAVL